MTTATAHRSTSGRENTEETSDQEPKLPAHAFHAEDTQEEDTARAAASSPASNRQLHEDAATDDEFAKKNEIARTAGMNMEQATTSAPLVSDLPDDIKAQMLGADKMQEEELILKVLAVPGNIYTVDKIVMVLWYTHKTKIERSRIQQRLRALIFQCLAVKEGKGRGHYVITDMGKRLLGV